MGDEGGFAPNLKDEGEAIDLIIASINKAGYSTKEVKLALDVASSEWWIGNGKYKLPKANTVYTPEELINRWSTLINKYPILSIEDPLGEKDYDGWSEITRRLGGQVMLVGDDLFVTNSKRLQLGFDM